MEVIADLHLHSHYSRAVSPKMVIPEMAKWAKIKGIDLLGTGDFTHSRWLEELKENLEEEEGVLRLKGNERDKGNKGNEVGFLLTAEISSIYSQGGKCRRIHNLIFAPSFSTVEKINNELAKRGCNLKSDGRPIIGLSSKNLAELIFSIDKNCLIIPAHVWTPWFSLYGSKSGFDSIEECFGEYFKNIFAIETGLSSDPEMNWGVRDLDNRQILSFSDAHSLQNIGREATIFRTMNNESRIMGRDLVFNDIIGAIKNDGSSDWKVGYTIEFYPEEGMYHYSGHRKCGVVFGPEEILKNGTNCLVCGKKLTIGVVERVRDLGGLGVLAPLRPVATGLRLGQGALGKLDNFGVSWFGREGRPPFVKLVPLLEIIAESLGVGDKSKRVINEYNKLITNLGSEMEILLKLNLDEVAKISGSRIAEGIKRVRSGEIIIRPGFDGEYGKVKVFEKE